MEKDIVMNQEKKTQSIADFVFLNQHSNYYVFKKVTKISEALYLISDLLSSSEPLRMSLRKIANGLLESFSSYKSGLVPENITPIFMILERQIHLGVMSSLISRMNGEILSNEINNLVSEIKAMDGKSGVLFPEIRKDFFTVEQMQVGESTLYKGQISSNVLYKDKEFKQSFKNYGEKDMVKKDGPPKLISKEERSFKILNIIKQSKGQISIKDIVASIKDCSEKTVQRELTELLDKGLIKKTGERRWSKYFI